MTAATAKAIVAAAEEMGLDVTVYENYSGRGMFGERTTAVEYDGESDLTAAVAVAAANHPSPSGFAAEVRGFRRDQMGKGRIAY